MLRVSGKEFGKILTERIKVGQINNTCQIIILPTIFLPFSKSLRSVYMCVFLKGKLKDLHTQKMSK